MAIKILAYGDAGQPTGFEKVMRNVLTYLHETERFDVTLYGLGYRGNPDMKYPFPVWPAEHHGDFFGFSNLAKAVEKHTPDIFFSTQDIWNLTSYMAYKPEELPAVCYFPVDTPNLKWSYAIGSGAMAEPTVYTNFGAMEAAAGVRDAVNLLIEGADENNIPVTERRTWLSMPHPSGTSMKVRMDQLSALQNIERWNVIPHGLDKEKFTPLDKAKVRKEWGMNEGDFIVGAINTNQFRKRQDTLMRMFAVLAHNVPRAKLVIYCNGNDERGWDLQQLARYFGFGDKIYPVHQQISRDLTDQEMCELYSACDVMINTAGGEGWGLTSFEGAACKTAQMVPNWSATRELWKDNGLLIPAIDWRFEPKFLNTAHAILDVQRGAQMLIDLANDEEDLHMWQDRAYDLACKQPSWNEVGKLFERLMFKTMNNGRKPATSRSFEDFLGERKGVVESELARAVYMNSDGTPYKLPK